MKRSDHKRVASLYESRTLRSLELSKQLHCVVDPFEMYRQIFKEIETEGESNELKLDKCLNGEEGDEDSEKARKPRTRRKFANYEE
jgi:hypothetical protein